MGASGSGASATRQINTAATESMGWQCSDVGQQSSHAIAAIAPAYANDNNNPTVSAYSPANNAVDISVSTQIGLTFSEDVKGVAGKYIYIKKSSDDSVVEKIDATCPKVSISGKEVSIQISSPLRGGTKYYVAIDSGAFADKSETQNAYAGIGDKTSWTFTTSAVIPGQNLLVNSRFDSEYSTTQSPIGWSTTGTSDADFVEFGGYSNYFNLTHYSGSAYSTYTYQTVTGLANGVYTAKAMVKSSGSQNSCYFEAKDYGGASLKYNILQTASWTEVSIGNIQVTNSQCTIGFIRMLMQATV